MSQQSKQSTDKVTQNRTYSRKTKKMDEELKSVMVNDTILLQEMICLALSEPELKIVTNTITENPIERWVTNLKDLFMKTLLYFDERELINLKPSDLKKLRKTMGRLCQYGRASFAASDGNSEDIKLIDFVATQTGVRVALIDVHTMDCTIFGGVQPFKTFFSPELVLKSPKWSILRKEIPFIILKQTGIQWQTNSSRRKMKTPTQYYHVTNDHLLNLCQMKKYSKILHFLNKMQFIRCQALDKNGFEIGDWKNDFETSRWIFDQSEIESQRIQQLLIANISYR